MSATDPKTFQVGYGRNKVTVVIDPEFESLIAPLSDLEFAQLKENIRNTGYIRDRLAVWPVKLLDDRGFRTGKPIAYLLVDGHNRYRAWKEMTDEGEVLLQLPIIEVELVSRDEAMLWIEENQIGRRNLTDDQRAVIWDSIRERRSTIARKERAAAARAAQDRDEPRLSAKTTDKPPEAPAKRDTRKEVAAESGLPENKLRAVAALKKSNPDKVQDVRAGRMSLREARKQTKGAKPKPEPAPAPEPLTVKALLDWYDTNEVEGMDQISFHRRTGYCKGTVDVIFGAIDPTTAKKLAEFYLQLKKTAAQRQDAAAITALLENIG